jgi:hypothetical protein
MRVFWIGVLAGCGFQSQAAAPDAASTELPEPDAPLVIGFDYARCPASYNAALPGPTRYRLLIDGHRAWEHSDACNLDVPGATHLAVVDTTDELAAMVAFLAQANGIAHDGIWLGGVQRRTALQPGEAWIGFDDSPLPVELWDRNEPNDGGGTETDHLEQFTMLEHAHTALTDVNGSVNSGALCECDGVPLNADVVATIEANRLAN